MMLMLPVFADTVPCYMDNLPKSAIGLFQTGEALTVYSEPDINSVVVKEYNFTYKPDSMPEGLFAALVNEKNLGLIYVTDIGDDNWVEILYNKSSGEKGWVQTEDRMQFLPWISFYNLYGRKYGLRLLNDSPDEIKILRARPEDESQGVGKLNYVKKIKLTVVRGNWALVSVMDLDKTLKTGYIKWRNSDGVIYAFPNVK